MARNEEKHYGKLNRLYLMKQREEYEKTNPKRPRLDTLSTFEDIKKWIPSIKRDIDFYLKKSQVTCYSDAHVEDCRKTVGKLEKEFKLFVRKMKLLSHFPIEATPWTSRPYKRKISDDPEEVPSKEFKRIATPILQNEQSHSNDRTLQFLDVNWNLMDQPLSFSSVSSSKDKNEENNTKPSIVNYDSSDSESL